LSADARALAGAKTRAESGATRSALRLRRHSRAASAASAAASLVPAPRAARAAALPSRLARRSPAPASTYSFTPPGKPRAASTSRHRGPYTA
jgi:hypothetical protein